MEHKGAAARPIRLDIDLLLEVPNHVAPRPVFTHQVPPPVPAELPPAPNLRRVLPHELREVARVLGEVALLEVVVLPLVAPQVHAARHVGAAQRDVLAVRPARVGEPAVAVPVEVVLAEALERVVPADPARVVLGAEEVGAVEHGRGEGVVRDELPRLGGDGGRGGHGLHYVGRGGARNGLGDAEERR
ncbi:uncharacterized protein E0L32_005225 [Thyridium curvatum]|uniref:Uncharacterized protein n=1 Tax=Thyridium curvatum TaxID=1093900 RepID=A0A507B3W3_9PEZI|nr:uncharacterized protein E0L32_005225 [Thyridium curvatum]TPX14533.1 hypothetical protein E0L32_005225 [Thyridium curvatum]